MEATSTIGCQVEPGATCTTTTEQCNSVQCATAQCWVLNMGRRRWESGVVSHLRMPRYAASVVSLPVGTYVLGGGGIGVPDQNQETTSDFLPAGATSWTQGPDLPTSTWSWFDFCAVSISSTQFLAISGIEIREFDLGQTSGDPTSSNGWLGPDTWPNLLGTWRRSFGCGVVNKKVIVAGPDITTEIIDIDTKTTRRGPDMVERRKWFQLLPVVESDSKSILAAVGGYQAGPGVPAIHMKAVEKWDPVSETWRETEHQLVAGRIRYGAVTVDKALVCG